MTVVLCCFTLVISAFASNGNELSVSADIVDCANQAEASSEDEEELKSNIVIGTWNDSYLRYNCYTYALRRTDGKRNPGYYSKGIMSFIKTDTIYQIALKVEADLQELGYGCIKMEASYPNNIPSTHLCICVRKGENSSNTDFHFMRYDGSYWSHKPGNTNPLIYKYMPSASISWPLEYSFKNEIGRVDFEYTGTIYYFIYAAEHTCSESWTGEDYHANDENAHYYEFKYTCTNCGDSYTEWSSLPCRGGNYCITPWNLRDEPMAA